MINLLLSGTAGLGKTTVARALCEELGLEYLLINGSEETSVDVIRNRVRQFASSISLQGEGKVKVVIFDEADNPRAQASHKALMGFIEEFSSSCRFVFTCNFKNVIPDPIHSRCAGIEFNTSRKELAKLAPQFHKRLSAILKGKGIKFDPKVLAELIMKYAPDWRRTINECQRHSMAGELSVASLVGVSNQELAALMGFLKAKKFNDMRKWVAGTASIDSTSLFRSILDASETYIEAKSVPSLVLILSEYQYKNAFASDKELNTVACLTEIMGSIQFK